DAPPDDALPRRGRALPAHRAHGPRPHPDRQHAGRAARRGPWRRGRDDRAPQAPRRRAAPEARGRERRPGLRRAAPRDARERGRLAGRERGPRPRRSAPRGGSQRRGGPAHHRIARRRLHRADGRRPVRGPDGGPPMTRSLAILLWVRGAGVPLAPADEPVRLNLAEAVEQARRNSPRLEELRALHTAADEELRGAKAGRLPTVDLQASYYRYSRVPELVLTLPGNRLQTGFPNLQDRHSTSAALSLPLYTGGRVSGQVEAARQGALATGKDAETGLSDLVLETITAYWDLVSSRESERVLAESIKSYEADLKQVRDRAEGGMAARNDVLNVQVERDQAELDGLQAATGAAIANETLVRLLGLGPGSRVEPTEPVTAATPADEPVEALVAKALDDRPEIAGLRARVAAAD